jgi:hypothetical protein
VARYTGPVDGSGKPTGDIEAAANFVCVPPIEVRIEPDTLNLKSKGELTAFITVPEGYRLRDWKIGNLTLEGAPAVKGMLVHNTYIAEFKRQDLKSVTPGPKVTLTVKGTFKHEGKLAQIQASDTVRVMK